jgi:hypothetical protein
MGNHEPVHQLVNQNWRAFLDPMCVVQYIISGNLTSGYVGNIWSAGTPGQLQHLFSCQAQLQHRVG